MRLKLGLLFLVFVLSVVLLVVAWWIDAMRPHSQVSLSAVSFVVSRGETASSVINRLKLENLIKSELAAKIYLKFLGLDNRIKPGTYHIPAKRSLPDLIDILVSGPKDVWVTIPEGWRREQIAARLKNNLESFDAEEFVSLSADFEGYLFPDTYLIPTHATPSSVLKIFMSNFSKKTGLNPENSGVKEIVTIASLIEREAKTDSERPIIAGIIYNRLRAGLPLQIDASVQYAAGNLSCQTVPVEICDWWQPITNTKLPSPYNTYLHPGLPPSPISNPGLASIRAAISPQNTSYWYYLHDPSGNIHYASTLEEHNRNIDKYLSP